MLPDIGTPTHPHDCGGCEWLGTIPATSSSCDVYVHGSGRQSYLTLRWGEKGVAQFRLPDPQARIVQHLRSIDSLFHLGVDTAAATDAEWGEKRVVQFRLPDREARDLLSTDAEWARSLEDCEPPPEPEVS